MKPALYAVTEVEIVTQLPLSLSQNKIAPPKRYLFKARGGNYCLTVTPRFSGHEMEKDEQILPTLEKDQKLELIELSPTQHFTQPPPRFSEASLVKTLEKMGIGRPSTYATIISTIQDRGYVKHENVLFTQQTWERLLLKNSLNIFPKYWMQNLPRTWRTNLTKLKRKKIEWLNVLNEFYEPFKTDLERAIGEMKSVKGTPEESNQKCTVCGQPMVVRWGKHGKFLGCSAFPKCKKHSSIGWKG